MIFPSFQKWFLAEIVCELVFLAMSGVPHHMTVIDFQSHPCFSRRPEITKPMNVLIRVDIEAGESTVSTQPKARTSLLCADQGKCKCLPVLGKGPCVPCTSRDIMPHCIQGHTYLRFYPLQVLFKPLPGFSDPLLITGLCPGSRIIMNAN